MKLTSENVRNGHEITLEESSNYTEMQLTNGDQPNGNDVIGEDVPLRTDLFPSIVKKHNMYKKRIKTWHETDVKYTVVDKDLCLAFATNLIDERDLESEAIDIIEGIRVYLKDIF